MIRRNSWRRVSACIGRVVPVLFERKGRHPGQLIGRSPHSQAVHAAAEPSLLGCIAEVAIAGARPNSLSGVLVPQGSITG